MPADALFLIVLIALSVLFITVAAVHSRRQHASSTSINAEVPAPSDSVDGSTP